MIRTYNIHEAKTHLSRLLEYVRNGDEVLIAKAGRTIAKVIPAADRVRPPRRLGTAVGLGFVPDDFNAPDPELERLFYDGPVFPLRKSRPKPRKRSK